MIKFSFNKLLFKYLIVLLNIATLFFSSIEAFAYVDAIAPIVSNLQISSTNVKPGDTIYVSADISDNESLENIDGYFYFNYKSRYITIFLNYNNLTGKLEGSYLVPDDILNVTWEAKNFYVYDLAGNRTDLDVTGMSFSASGGKDPDITPPVVSNIVISSTSVTPGDTLYISADIEDESKLGCYATLYVQNSVNSFYQITVDLFYNSETDKLEGSYLVPDDILNVTWEAKNFYVYDLTGNRTDLDVTGMSFSASGGKDPDITPPVVSNIVISSTSVTPGDTLYISADIEDESKLGCYATLYVQNSVNSFYQITVDLFYNSETDKLEGSYLVPDDILNVTWEAKNFYVYDLAGNRTDLDVTGMSFSASGGKDPDITPPVVSNIVFSSASVVPGDTIYVSADISDNESLENIDGYFYFNYKSRYITIFLNYNNLTGKLEGSYLVPDDILNVTWEAKNFYVYDLAGNRTDLDVTGMSFSASGGKDPDITPPVVSNIVISSTSVTPGDTLYISADIEDESKEGSYTYLSFVDPKDSANDINVMLFYNSSSNKLEGSYPVNDRLSNGTWIGRIAETYDGSGNYSENDVSELTFLVSDSEEVTLSNIIESVKLDKNIVTIGDTVKLTVKLKDIFNEIQDFNVLLTVPDVFSRMGLSDPINISTPISLEYSEISGAYIAEIEINDTFVNGDYYISSLFSSDDNWNFLTYDEMQNIFFTVIGSDKEIVKPILMPTEVSISSEALMPGDTLKFTVKVDSNITPTPVGSVTLAGPMSILEDKVRLEYNSVEGKLEGFLLIDDSFNNGEWYIKSLNLGYLEQDGQTNLVTFQGSNEILKDIKFQIVGGSEVVDSKITVRDISVSAKELFINESLEIQIKVDGDNIENLSGYASFKNQYGQTRHLSLEYNMSNNMFEGTLNIDSKMVAGDWFPTEVRLFNYNNVNEAVNFGEYDLNFKLVDGANPPVELQIENLTFSKSVVENGDYVNVRIQLSNVRDDLYFTFDMIGPDGDRRPLSLNFNNIQREADEYSRGFVIDPYMLNGDWFVSNFKVGSFEYGADIELDTSNLVDKAFSVSGNLNTIIDYLVEGIENNSIYNYPVALKFKYGYVDAIIDDLLLREIESGYVFDKEGRYLLYVTDRFQNQYEIRFEIDMAVPIVTGIENSKIYTVPVTIAFNEGVATLNGQAFTSGTNVSTAGKYVLVVEDKAGNVTKVNFEIANPNPTTPSTPTEQNPTTQTTVTSPSSSAGTNNQISQTSYVEKLNDLTEILSDESVSNLVFTNLLKDIFNLNPDFISELDEVEQKALEDKILEVYESTLGIRVEGNSELKLEGYSFIDDLDEILKGSKIEVLVQVSEEINSTDQSLIDSYVSKNNLDSTMLYSIDLELFKSINGVEEILSTLKQPVTITLPLPSKFAGVTDFTVIHVHEGTIIELPVIINGDGTFSFTTDKFSSFTLIDAAKMVPVIEEVEQSKNELTWLWGGSLIIIVALAAYFIRKRSKIVG